MDFRQKPNKKTIDYEGIKERFKPINVTIDWNRIDKIRDYRNDAEHYFSTLQHKAVQGLISNSFIVIRDFISQQLQEDPKELLGSYSWSILVAIHEVHENEKEDCNNLLETLEHFSETIFDALVSYSCNECGSD